MKTNRLPLLVIALVMGSILLSACTGGTLVHSWPGLTASQNTALVAYQGQVFAVNVDNGSLACKFPEKADAGKPFFSPPTISDNLIVVGNYGHFLYGLDPKCNEKSVFNQKWVFNTETEDPDRLAGNFASGALIVNDLVLAPSTNNRLYAISAQTGKLAWPKPFESKNTLWAAPVSDGTNAYLPAMDHNLYALRLTDGSVVWKKDLGSALVSSPLLTKEGLLYISTLEGNVVALNGADGSSLWTANTGGRLWSTPVLHQDLLYVGNAANKVLAISTKDGKTTWQKDAGSPILGGGVVLPDTNTIAFPTEGGNLVAWSLDGQKQAWTQAIGGKLYTTPVIAGQTAVVAVTEGDKLLQGVNANGQLSWTFVVPK